MTAKFGFVRRIGSRFLAVVALAAAPLAREPGRLVAALPSRHEHQRGIRYRRSVALRRIDTLLPRAGRKQRGEWCAASDPGYRGYPQSERRRMLRIRSATPTWSLTHARRSSTVTSAIFLFRARSRRRPAGRPIREAPRIRSETQYGEIELAHDTRPLLQPNAVSPVGSPGNHAVIDETWPSA